MKSLLCPVHENTIPTDCSNRPVRMIQQDMINDFLEFLSRDAIEGNDWNPSI
jgi:hypothetical protein